MNIFNTILVLAAAFLAVFGETVFSAPRHLFAAQIDLLPALMIYAALNTNVVSVSIFAVAGGLWFDALSANPLGVTILPLFAVGFLAQLERVGARFSGYGLGGAGFEHFGRDDAV